MKTLLAALILSGCTTAENRNAKFQSAGSVKSLTAYADGTIHAQDIGSPLTDIIRAINNAMLGAVFFK